MKNDHEEKHKESGCQSRFIEFNIGKESYAFPLMTIQEVISPPETTPIPNGPHYMTGVMNLRGKVISIIDSRKKIQTTPLEDKKQEAVIIIKISDINIGLVVDSINRVQVFPEDRIDRALDVQNQHNTKYVNGIYHEGDQITFLLDPYSLLGIDFEKTQEDAA